MVDISRRLKWRSSSSTFLQKRLSLRYPIVFTFLLLSLIPFWGVRLNARLRNEHNHRRQTLEQVSLRSRSQHAFASSKPTKHISPNEKGRNASDRSMCSATGDWYSCETPECKFTRPCLSQPGLAHCSCTFPTSEEVQGLNDTKLIDEIVRHSNPCIYVNIALPLEQWDRCREYLEQPLVQPQSNCAEETRIPRILSSVGKDSTPPRNFKSNALANPTFAMHYYSDREAYKFLHKFCGEEAAAAYDCFAGGAHRADLFRFCKLYVDGGVYMDSDLMLLQPLEETVSMCSGLTMGVDYPYSMRDDETKSLPGKQMKLISSLPGHPIIKCMVDRIVENVKLRAYPRNPLMISGPQLLHQCYFKHQKGDVDITYRDSREARFPYSGMMGRERLLAFESPNEYHPALVDTSNRNTKHYSKLYDRGILYRDKCHLKCPKGPCLERAPWAPRTFIEANKQIEAIVRLNVGGHKQCRKNDSQTSGMPDFLWTSSPNTLVQANDPSAYFQADGNFVVYTNAGDVLWDSGTFQPEINDSTQVYLELQANGVLVIIKQDKHKRDEKKIMWQSNGREAKRESILVLLPSGTLGICEKG